MADPISIGAAVVAAGAATVSAYNTIASSNNVDEIYDALDGAMMTLVAHRNDLQRKVQRTMMPSDAYTNWIEQVSKVEKKMEAVRNSYIKRTKNPLNLISSSKITKRMKRIALDVSILMEKNIADLTFKKPPAPVIEIITPRINHIPTLQQPLDQILDWLCDEKVTGIRIQGTVGIGKTTIMQNLNNHVKVGEMFSIVIWVTVSREGSTENKGIDQIQQVISRRLKVNEDMTTDLDTNASILKEWLKDFTYLLLLDDVRENLDLVKIGVPINDNGSKIVFTTRYQHVCFKIANRHTVIKKLNEKEALKMFKSVLNRPDHEKKYYIKRLIDQIVKWCGYHPLMINVAAGVFSMKITEGDDDADIQQSWIDGLTNLHNWIEGNDEMQKFYRSLKCCFDCLEVTKKKCFFYSVLYPEDSDIPKACLLDNWAAEKLLGTDVTMMHGIGREILEDLINKASLIEKTTSKQCIRIPKLIHQAALYNLSTNEDQGSLVKSGEALQKHPDAECWKEKKWISLVDSKMQALPDQPDCSMLSTLFLQKNLHLKAIPETFFTHMQSLYVLDLYDTGITSLPSSLLELISLKVLYLQNCVALAELPGEIKKLEKLEVLDIRGSGIKNIPPQVDTLSCLRRLLVSFTIPPSQNPIEEATKAMSQIQIEEATKAMRKIQIQEAAKAMSEMISKLGCLKELVIEIEESLEEILYASIVNVVTLTSLSLLQFCSSNKVRDIIKAFGNTLKIHFPNEELLQSYINKVNSDELKKCQIFTGCDISSQPRIGESMVYYYMFKGEVSNNIISQVLCNDVFIELVNHNELEHLSTLTAEKMNRILSCVIEGCAKMRTVVEANVGGSLILSKVEELHMINLPLLKNICEGSMQGLNSLKTLILRDCPLLTAVCRYGVILKLPEICHLEVRDCSKIEELFSGSTNIVPPVLPNLKILILDGLPELRSILASHLFNWPSLEELTILNCHKLKRLPFQKDTAQNLTSIKAEKKWWDDLENDEEVKNEFAGRCECNLI